MNKTWIVTFETYLRQIKSWSFISLVFMPFVFFGFVFAFSYFAAPSASKSDIAVISTDKALRTSFIKESQIATTKKYQTLASAKAATKRNDIAGYLVLSTDKQQLRAKFTGPNAVSSGDKAKIQQFLATIQGQRNLQQAKLTSSQVKALAVQPKFTQELQRHAASDKTAKTVSFYIVVFFVYLILTTYSAITAQEIAADKGTKIMEVIFSSTTPRKYFNGKIYGVLLVIVTQLLVYLIGGFAVIQFAQHSALTADFWEQNTDLINQVIHNLVSINLLFALLAVLLYTIASAFCGALVTRVADASKAAQPVIYLSMLAFFMALAFQNTPDNLFVKIFSYIPFFSSYFMPLRLINGMATMPAAVISLLILITTIVGSMLYIGRIYGGLMLQTDELGFWGNLKRGLSLK
ncbi:ABC transporter permease [Lactiplantibacillus pentosus]|uniref:ABC transporter permease n=1 Tax=Lactiplantibacillus pentosus TaxID=1589 RepID=A0AAW8VUZ0_LACPE|nr:ABC transporter permease [Lactiplantibacillus pentosus]ASG80510.1 ABC transporter permease [Lactiplantibacillus pentosus]MBU7473851.1 ABC transporter permease [Lactiplantibacillus pentosus]MBU7529013.1 ABC transporter permease [Lactiplantibacillus pentosus]MCT3306687.1 ABC transporter permease [Lactiplantibacillus pentosus]MDT6989200.1 ABC transporter permease [Lactiplantibacillus pentosus]